MLTIDRADPVYYLEHILATSGKLIVFLFTLASFSQPEEKDELSLRSTIMFKNI